MCDLERNRPIDVLADRSVPTVSTWCEERPRVAIVSRDRSSEYAAAISKGAPQALQVADLWQIAKHGAERVQTLVARGLAEIRPGLQTQATPEARQRRRRPSLIDPSERSVLNWWQEGHRISSQLSRERKAEALQGVTQGQVQVSGDRADTSIRLIQVDPIQTAKAHEWSAAACTPGKLLGAAGHLAVCASRA
jgi:transposase